MKKRMMALLLLCSILTGCSGSEAEAPVQEESIAEAEQTSQLHGTIYYVTDHGTVDAAGVSEFSAELEELGYTWKADVLRGVPAASDTVLVLNTPTEDLTPQDLDALETLFDAGGNMLLLLPASDAPLRFKYLERVLEEFYIQVDYDVLSETAEGRSMKDDPTCLRMDIGGIPEYMPSEGLGTNPAYLRNVRSFHFFVGNGTYDYDAIKHDAMLQTAVSAVGTPCGGTEEDPPAFEGERLTTMLYARNDQRLNASIVVMGSADFLNDAQVKAPEAVTARIWVMSAIYWLAMVYH